MAFNVNEFITHFDSHAGFARTSKFEVRINIPRIMVGAGTTRELSLQCEQAELPGYAINVVEQKIFGPPTYMAGTSAFGDITLTFICAGDLWEKKFFDTWLDFMVPKRTYLVSYKEDYQTSVTIHQFSDYISSTPQPPVNQATGQNQQPAYVNGLLSSSINGIPPNAPSQTFNQLNASNPPPDAFKPSEIYSCRLINAFPINVNAMQLNWGNDDIHRLAVTFKYDKWLNTTTKSPTNIPPTRPTPGVNGDNQRENRGTFIPNNIPSVFGGGGGGRFSGGGASGGW